MALAISLRRHIGSRIRYSNRGRNMASKNHANDHSAACLFLLFTRATSACRQNYRTQIKTGSFSQVFEIFCLSLSFSLSLSGNLQLFPKMFLPSLSNSFSFCRETLFHRADVTTCASYRRSCERATSVIITVPLSVVYTCAGSVLVPVHAAHRQARLRTGN